MPQFKARYQQSEYLQLVLCWNNKLSTSVASLEALSVFVAATVIKRKFFFARSSCGWRAVLFHKFDSLVLQTFVWDIWTISFYALSRWSIHDNSRRQNHETRPARKVILVFFLWTRESPCRRMNVVNRRFSLMDKMGDYVGLVSPKIECLWDESFFFCLTKPTHSFGYREKERRINNFV